MSVYDRWHLTHPTENDKPCKCGRGRNRLFPSSDHGQGQRWQVRYRDDEGRQRKRNFDERYGDNIELHAEAFDADTTAKLNARTYIDPDAGKISLETYARQWLAAQTSDLSTRENLERWWRLRIQGTPLGGRELAFLARRPSVVQQWVKGLESDLGPRSIKWALDMLAGVFNAAVDDELIAKNPVHAKSVRAPAAPESKAVPFTFEQLIAAREALPDRFAAMVDLGYGAGMRQGEMFGLAVEDIDFIGRREVKVLRQVKIVANTLIFAPPKGGKTRAVPVDDDLLLALSAHIEGWPPVEVTLPWGRPDGPPVTHRLLFSYDGPRYKGACRRDLINKMWRAARREAGIPLTDEYGMHGLRHTFASACLAGGVDIIALAAWLGHSDPGFTLRTYTHLMPSAPERGRKAMKAFRAFGSGAVNEGVSARKVP